MKDEIIITARRSGGNVFTETTHIMTRAQYESNRLAPGVIADNVIGRLLDELDNGKAEAKS